MAIRFVRPDTSHSGSRDGLTYATAWGAWSEVVWAQLVAGSTLYVCGRHLIAAQTQTGAHGGTSGSRVTITGDYPADPGIIQITGAGNIWWSNSRSHTVIDNIWFIGKDTQALYIQPNTANCRYANCVFEGTTATAGCIVSLEPSGTYTDTVFDTCAFTGLSVYALRWLVSSAGTTGILINFSVINCNFHDFVSRRAALELRTVIGVNTATRMQNVVIADNTFRNIQGVCAEISDTQNIYGNSAGVTVTDNIFEDCTWDRFNASPLGGAIGVNGFGKLYGAHNRIAGNEIRRVYGVGGGVDVFYGTYLIDDNLFDTIGTSPGAIDGTAIIFDTGSDGVIATRNRIKNVVGDAGVVGYSSGSAFTILQANNVLAFANIVEGCKIGISYGNHSNGFGTQSSKFVNNLFLNCANTGMYVGALNTSMENNKCANNVFTYVSASVPIVYKFPVAAWTQETNNVFYGGGTATNFSPSASSLTSDPKLDTATFKLMAGSPCIGAGTFVAYLRDFGGGSFKLPSSIGAYESYAIVSRSIRIV